MPDKLLYSLQKPQVTTSEHIANYVGSHFKVFEKVNFSRGAI